MNNRRDVRPETYGIEETGSTGQWFVNMAKAFDTVPREIVMATLRWIRVPEAEVGMVGGHVREDNSKSGGGRRSFGGV